MTLSDNCLWQNKGMLPETTVDQPGVADGIGLGNDGVRALSVEGLKVVGVSTAP